MMMNMIRMVKFKMVKKRKIMKKYLILTILTMTIKEEGQKVKMSLKRIRVAVISKCHHGTLTQASR